MKSMKKLLMVTALAAGALAMTASPARAAHVGIYVGVGAPGAYIPPSPGPGYAWVGGYWSGGYWVPGYWNRVGVGYVGPVARFGFYGDHDRDFNRDRDHDYYRDHDRDRDHDGDRFRR